MALCLYCPSSFSMKMPLAVSTRMIRSTNFGSASTRAARSCSVKDPSFGALVKILRWMAMRIAAILAYWTNVSFLESQYILGKEIYLIIFTSIIRYNAASLGFSTKSTRRRACNTMSRVDFWELRSPSQPFTASDSFARALPTS